MKWGTPDHPKVSHLAGLLGIEIPHAVGLLECFWHWTAKYRPDGSLKDLDDHSIAAACRWHGDASPFVRALEKTRWVDVSPMRRVHGWSEHAENAVHTRLAEARMLFCDGTVPKVAGLDSRARDQAKSELAEVRARWEVEASPEYVSPRSPQGVPMGVPGLAVALAVANGDGSTTAPPTPRQKTLAMGPKPVNPRPTQPAENVEALKRNIEELAELWDMSFDRTAIAITSGLAVQGRKVCAGTISFDTMSDKHMRRSIVDSNTAIARERRERGIA